MKVLIMQSFPVSCHFLLLMCISLSTLFCDVGRDSSDGFATDYGLDGPGIESRWGGEILLTGPGAHLALYKMGTGSLFRR